MPSGRTHDFITWMLVPPVAYATWQCGASWLDTACLGGAFLFAGLMFSGDLDLSSVQYHRWGPLRWLWLPYRALVPHRSVLSHGILLGPAFRLAYLSAMLVVVGLVGLALAHAYLGGPVPQEVVAQGLPPVAITPSGWRHLGYALAGLWLGGASHTLADTTVSALKRPFGRRRRRH
jgi:uncharacterized metal-binding protein